MLDARQEFLFLIPVLAVGAYFLRSVFLAELPPPITIAHFVQAQSLKIDSTSPLSNGILQNTRSFASGQFLGDDFVYFFSDEPGPSVIVELPELNPGDYSFILHLARSGDFGTVRIYINDTMAVESVDLYTPGVGALEVAGGTHRLSGNGDQLKIEIIGTNPESQAPHHQIGFDGVQIIPAQ